jgi:prepilin-type N-terminal cleavage/methylation domain-containing protein
MTPRRGFTLIELMVVISVIVLLMALIIPAIGLARRKGLETKTRSTLMQIEAGIGKFKTENARLPEDSVIDQVMYPGKKYLHLFTAPGYAAKDIDKAAIEQNAAYLLSDLATVDNENFGKQSPYRGSTGTTSNLLVDAWDKPVVYRPFSLYPFATGTGMDAINSESPPNPDSYQLWSFGYARLNDNGEKDDIATWKK